MTLCREDALLERLAEAVEVLSDETEGHLGCKDHIEAGVSTTDPDHGVPCRMCLWLIKERLLTK